MLSKELSTKFNLGNKELQKIKEMEKIAYDESNQVIITDKALHEYINTIVDKVQTIHIPNGIDIVKFHPIPQQTARERLLLPPNKMIVTYISNMKSPKAPIFIAKVFKQVASSYKNVVFLIVGEGERQRHMKTILLNTQSIFMGKIPYHQMPFVINASNLICNALRIQGYSRVSLEAMACRVPLLTTPLGCIEPFKQDANCFVAPLTVNEYAENVTFLVNSIKNHAEIITSVITNAQEMIKQHFSTEYVAGRIAEICKRVGS